MSTSPEPKSSAWREPMMWLVVGGPLVVVVAGIVTAVIAWRGADPLVSSEPAASSTQSASMQPALKARNHAAAPQP